MTEDLPTDWLISNEELKALKKYILYRAQHLNEEKYLRLPGLRLFCLSDLGANTQGFPVWKAVNRKLEETLLKEEALQPEASETDRLQAS